MNALIKIQRKRLKKVVERYRTLQKEAEELKKEFDTDYDGEGRGLSWKCEYSERRTVFNEPELALRCGRRVVPGTNTRSWPLCDIRSCQLDK